MPNLTKQRQCECCGKPCGARSQYCPQCKLELEYGAMCGCDWDGKPTRRDHID